METMKEERRLSSSSREISEYSDLLARVEGESAAKQSAVERAEAAEHQSQMVTLDLKSVQDELEEAKRELGATHAKVMVGIGELGQLWESPRD